MTDVRPTRPDPDSLGTEAASSDPGHEPGHAGPMDDGAPPARRAALTLAEVARVAGVSRMTASRAINNRPGVSRQMREDILRIADEMGYVVNRVAQKLSTARNGGGSGIIGVIAELHTPFVGDLVMAIGSAVRGGGQDMLVYSLPAPTRVPPGKVLDLLHQMVDGVIAVLPYEADYLTALERARVPVVSVERGSDETTFPSISADSYQGGCLAMRHLIELGHRRIGFITGAHRLASARERLRAYRDTLAAHGLPIDPTLIVEGDYLQKSGFDAANRLLALRDRPTAIFAANDISALGAITAIHDAGLDVPRDISIVGFDDIPLVGQLRPGLTTIRQPLTQMGRTAVKMLLEMIVSPASAPPSATVPIQLIVRGSTAAPIRGRHEA
ncbi:LacI family DNA-binding transcriptional regulator [Consotaella aegiceratis]|uniref:LacI family DNA-binding transcriptional regulator n=1 Tax=Consotaella aegiceratis TaxID=3097961 RepID=UPI002F4093F2